MLDCLLLPQYGRVSNHINVTTCNITITKKFVPFTGICTANRLPNELHMPHSIHFTHQCDQHLRKINTTRLSRSQRFSSYVKLQRIYLRMVRQYNPCFNEMGLILRTEEKQALTLLFLLSKMS
jgi:hypothetical protein